MLDSYQQGRADAYCIVLGLLGVQAEDFPDPEKSARIHADAVVRALSAFRRREKRRVLSNVATSIRVAIRVAVGLAPGRLSRAKMAPFFELADAFERDPE